MIQFYRCRAVLFLLFTMVIIGCGKPVGSLQGNVTYEGDKLTQGTVDVMASDGSVKHGFISEDGSYKVEDIGVGPATITVAVYTFTKGRRKKGEPEAKTGVVLPEKYFQHDTTPLKVTIASGRQTHDLQLTK
jgi:hypothetical protein